jgi:hypothetical protein
VDPAAELGMDPGEPYDTRPPRPRRGWVTTPPDFVIVGAADAGAERLAGLLAGHPGIHEVRPELRAWERYFETWPSDVDLERYRSFFARPAGLLSGELAPTTMSLFWAPRMLAAAAPDTRILVVLRDPVDRYLASRAHLERYRAMAAGWHYGPRSFTHWSAERSFQRGEYGLQLQWLADAFPSERTLVLQHEVLERDPDATLQRALDFLGLPGVDRVDGDVSTSDSTDAAPDIEPQRLAAIVGLYRPDVRRTLELVPDLDVSLWQHYRDMARTS